MLSLRRLYPLVAAAGLPVASALLAAGQAGAPSDVLDLTIAQYTALDRGGATVIALVLLGLSSAALLAGLRAAGAPVTGWPERLVLVWAGSLVCAAVVPGTGAADAMMVLAMVGLAGAAVLMAQRFGVDERWRPVARPMEWLALGAGGMLAVLTYVALPGHHVMIGLVEWSLLAIEIAVLAGPAAWLARLTWNPAEDGQAGAAPEVRQRPTTAGRTSGSVPAMHAPMTMTMAVGGGPVGGTRENSGTHTEYHTQLLSQR